MYLTTAVLRTIALSKNILSGQFSYFCPNHWYYLYEWNGIIQIMFLLPSFDLKLSRHWFTCAMRGHCVLKMYDNSFDQQFIFITSSSTILSQLKHNLIHNASYCSNDGHLTVLMKFLSSIFYQIIIIVFIILYEITYHQRAG